MREEILNLISSFLLLVALFKLIIFIILKLLYLKVIDVKEAYWLIPNNVLINMLKTDPNGLSSIEASFRLSKLGNNRLDTKKKISCPYFYLNLKVPLSLYLSLLHYCHFFLVKGKML